MTISHNGKAIFEFMIQNEIDDDPIFSPPFATSNDTFWQLKFYKTDPDNRESCILYLIAIPNHEEALTTNVWETRKKLSVVLYIKSQEYERYNPIKTDKFTVRSYSWGVNFPSLQDYRKVNIGIIFSDITIEKSQFNSEIISNQVSKELMATWIDESNNAENADIQLNFKDGIIHTYQSILSKRSEYFRKLFQERNDKKRKVDTNNNYVNIDIQEFSRQTFLKVIRFMYTGKIEFNNTDIIPMEIFKIADYYLISDLRQKARVEIYKRLHFDNVVKVLFSEGYKWKDLKDDMINYIVYNFDKIKDTLEYKLLAIDNRGHPAAIELMQEIISILFYKKSLK
ncbi:12391_t:CDS:2 [Funneliformis caledonium]|uniref:12391_t:CDS:1 n=1 Tax=Funneliformis caledonium TaxID=1117310 RepID=A0A9N8VHN2_9GLOM|nr:12391_t:CDS:2 [Funneliformis caledonium]